MINDIAEGSNRCSVCILPKQASRLQFDSDGVCDLCGNELKSDLLKPEDNVEELIKKVKAAGEKRSYDCLVGLSGGRDSTYLLSLLVERHGLRCLVAYYETPFTPKQIADNVQRVTEYYNVPIISIDISKDYHLDIAKKMTEMWLRRPSEAMANLSCSVCKMLNRDLYQIASEYKISTVFYGSNRFEAYQFSSAGHKVNEKNNLFTNFRKMLSLSKAGVNALVTYKGLWRYLGVAFKASILYISPHTPWLKFRYSRIRFIDYFSFASWDEDEADKIIEKAGWKLPPYANSYWRADCTFNEVKNCMFKMMNGVSYMDAYIANMVRCGYISREEGLKRISKEGVISKQRLSEACLALDLDPDVFLQNGNPIKSDKI